MTSKKHITLDIFNYKREKLCSLFDNRITAEGQIHDIVFVNQISGYKEVSFHLPYLVNKKRNFRWNYIRSEYLQRLRIGGYTDWFVIKNPTMVKNRKGVSAAITCEHISVKLKTKNQYQTFDDTNGIGTIEHLIQQALKGTGWTLGYCDSFLERDNTTEKIRSITDEGKTGTYQLITNICNLFGGYPIYDGDLKTVNIYALNNKKPLTEMTVGKDLDALSVSFNSEDIITRLYVEGEYGDFGYVGIDDVNPTGLSYLMNFDYYKEIGLFTDEHQNALDQYYIDMKQAIEGITSTAAVIGQKENSLNEIWGQVNCILYPVDSGQVGDGVINGDVSADQMVIAEGDKLTILKSDTHRDLTAGVNGAYELEDGDITVIKFLTLPSGKLGAKQVAVESKQKLIESQKGKINDTLSENRLNDIYEQIEKLEQEIDELYSGSEDDLGIYALMSKAVDLCWELRDLNYDRETARTKQEDIEADFAIAMGDMLKEGYWNNSNYTVGQESYLYEDAVDMMNQMSKPDVAYTVTKRSLADKAKISDLELNMQARIYDPDLRVNDFVYITTITLCLDREQDDSIEISNKDITLSGASLDSILSRMTQLADLIDQKNALFERSEAIEKDGSILLDRLEGQINILKNGLSSVVSSWYTDASGNIVFESTTGRSAMMLTGDGFMIANGKNDDGSWNWRTFGTGEGFTADAITTGYLSADRIEARAITAEKLASNVGAMIDLSENYSIKMLVEKEVANNQIYKAAEAPEEPTEGMLWLDISNEAHDILKRWNGTDWIETTISQEELDDVYSTLATYRTEIEQLDQSISLRVTQEQLNTEQTNKADTDWVYEKLESIIQQTSEDITFSFNQSKQFTVEATQPFQDFIQEVQSYQRFSEDGLELGVLNSPFIAKLGNTKLSFLQDGKEIAYISNNKQHITEARVTDRLSIGTEDNGYFDWITTETGLGQKWRG